MELKPDHLYRLAIRDLPDGRIVYLTQMAFTWRLCVGFADDEFGYDDAWCYHDRQRAPLRLRNGTGPASPPGGTGIRRAVVVAPTAIPPANTFAFETGA